VNNVIRFPACIRVGDWWWYAGKKYKHMGVLKKVLAPEEWQRVYEFQTRLIFSACQDAHRGGGSAA
jgi:hypothetical protein